MGFGVFKSFGDAPGGFEESKETYAVGAEYSYQDSFAMRMGYFHESPKGKTIPFLRDLSTM
jgi:hypothetical protein